MPDNASLIDRFYTAFTARDAEAMGACYADDVRFSDPVFRDLRGDRARGMWRMLCAQGKDLVVVHSEVQADDRQGSAHWEARYTFGPTGRAVHNVIEARFHFDGGQIIAHTDDFDLYAWTKMALGTAGTLLGWSPLVQWPLRKGADRGLRQYMARHSPR